MIFKPQNTKYTLKRDYLVHKYNIPKYANIYYEQITKLVNFYDELKKFNELFEKNGVEEKFDFFNCLLESVRDLVPWALECWLKYTISTAYCYIGVKGYHDNQILPIFDQYFIENEYYDNLHYATLEDKYHHVFVKRKNVFNDQKHLFEVLNYCISKFMTIFVSYVEKIEKQEITDALNSILNKYFDKKEKK